MFQHAITPQERPGSAAVALLHMMATRLRAAFWRKSARNAANVARGLEARVRELEEAQEEAIQGIAAAMRWVDDQEWVREDGGPAWRRVCPECRTTWDVPPITRPPEHDDTCEVGHAAYRLRHALLVLMDARK